MLAPQFTEPLCLQFKVVVKIINQYCLELQVCLTDLINASEANDSPIFDARRQS